MDDRSMFRLYALTFRRPPTLILDPFMRWPRTVLEELRASNPDEHALLTEHLVLPTPTDGEAT